MVTLQIQKFLDEQNLSVQELSDRAGITLASIDGYLSSINIELEEQVFEDLRKISDILKTEPLCLIQSRNPEKVFRFKIKEISQKEGISFVELCGRTQISPTILGFYITQVFTTESLQLQSLKNDLDKICEVLECQTSDLFLEVEKSFIRFNIQDFLNSKGIDLNTLAKLINLPIQIFEMLEINPIESDLLLVLASERENREEDIKLEKNSVRIETTLPTALKQGETLHLEQTEKVAEDWDFRAQDFIADLVDRICCPLKKPCCSHR